MKTGEALFFSKQEAEIREISCDGDGVWAKLGLSKGRSSTKQWNVIFEDAQEKWMMDTDIYAFVTKDTRGQLKSRAPAVRTSAGSRRRTRIRKPPGRLPAASRQQALRTATRRRRKRWRRRRRSRHNLSVRLAAPHVANARKLVIALQLAQCLRTSCRPRKARPRGRSAKLRKPRNACRHRFKVRRIFFGDARWMAASPSPTKAKYSVEY